MRGLIFFNNSFLENGSKVFYSNKISILWWFYDQGVKHLEKKLLFNFAPTHCELLAVVLYVCSIQHPGSWRGPGASYDSTVLGSGCLFPSSPGYLEDDVLDLYWFAKILEKLSIHFDPKATASSYLSWGYFPRYSPRQEARCRSRIVSFWSLGHLRRMSHTPQTSGSVGTNPSLHPQQCPLGSAGLPGATCGHHTPGRAGLGLVSGWTWDRQSAFQPKGARSPNEMA